VKYLCMTDDDGLEQQVVELFRRGASRRSGVRVLSAFSSRPLQRAVHATESQDSKVYLAALVCAATSTGQSLLRLF
jgi:hypothetical protein